jgi:hypothetical protein
MSVAEYVTAPAAVMSTIEIAESFGTGRVIADRSFRIRLRTLLEVPLSKGGDMFD